MCMRTNIELDEALLAEARKYSRASTRKALIEEALRTMVQVRAEGERTATYARRVQDFDQRLAGLKLREAPHRLLRTDRERA